MSGKKKKSQQKEPYEINIVDTTETSFADTPPVNKGEPGPDEILFGEQVETESNYLKTGHPLWDIVFAGHPRYSGLPLRAVSLVYGRSGIGKTWFLLSIVRLVLDSQSRPVFYIDTEGSVTESMVEALKLGESRFVYYRTVLDKDIHKILQPVRQKIASYMRATKEETKERLLKEIPVLIIVDSWTEIFPVEALSVYERSKGLKARARGRLLNLLQYLAAHGDIAILLTAQTRSALGQIDKVAWGASNIRIVTDGSEQGAVDNPTIFNCTTILRLSEERPIITRKGAKLKQVGSRLRIDVKKSRYLPKGYSEASTLLFSSLYGRVIDVGEFLIIGRYVKPTHVRKSFGLLDDYCLLDDLQASRQRKIEVEVLEPLPDLSAGTKMGLREYLSYIDTHFDKLLPIMEDIIRRRIQCYREEDFFELFTKGEFYTDINKADLDLGES